MKTPHGNWPVVSCSTRGQNRRAMDPAAFHLRALSVSLGAIPPGSARPAHLTTLRSEFMSQYIFTMDKVGKVVPPKKHILKDISLSFFPGAKIGVLGLNGSGKSGPFWNGSVEYLITPLTLPGIRLKRARR